jgi:hypothetical protein
VKGPRDALTESESAGRRQLDVLPVRPSEFHVQRSQSHQSADHPSERKAALGFRQFRVWAENPPTVRSPRSWEGTPIDSSSYRV